MKGNHKLGKDIHNTYIQGRSVSKIYKEMLEISKTGKPDFQNGSRFEEALNKRT